MPDETPNTAPMPGILRNRRKPDIVRLREAAVERRKADLDNRRDPFPPAETLRNVEAEDEGFPPEVLEQMKREGLTPAPSIAPSPLGPPTAEEFERREVAPNPERVSRPMTREQYERSQQRRPRSKK